MASDCGVVKRVYCEATNRKAATWTYSESRTCTPLTCFLQKAEKFQFFELHKASTVGTCFYFACVSLRSGYAQGKRATHHKQARRPTAARPLWPPRSYQGLLCFHIASPVDLHNLERQRPFYRAFQSLYFECLQSKQAATKAMCAGKLGRRAGINFHRSCIRKTHYLLTFSLLVWPASFAAWKRILSLLATTVAAIRYTRAIEPRMIARLRCQDPARTGRLAMRSCA